MASPSGQGEPERETILIVDDEPANIDVLRGLLAPVYRIKAATSGAKALQIMAADDPPALVLLDVMMPEMSGHDVLRELRTTGSARETPVIFVTAMSEQEDEAKGLALGAVDYITKPVRPALVLARVATHLRLAADRRRLEQELRVARAAASDAARRHELPLLGDSPAIRFVREAIVMQAGSTEPLLITGAPGVGQEAVAFTIHMRSSRRDRPFIRVDCADVGASGTGSLFATPSDDPDEKVARGWLADGGTLYLDGVERLPAAIQSDLAAHLARSRDDANAPDVRIIARAGEDISSRRSGFHADLARALAAQQLNVPSLVERRGDIEVLATQIVVARAQALGKLATQISERSLSRLMSYSWPGNVGELVNVLERAVTLAKGSVVEVDEALLGEAQRVGGYRLVERLGVGGMGEVWRGEHALLARPAAIKLVREDVHGLTEEMREALLGRFRREAQATATLRSPHTVELYDFGVTPAGALYYVMEYLEGIDLSTYLTAFGAMPAARAVPLLMQACESLAEAHARGLVHRDIKPANLMVCRMGTVPDFLKVLDFGIVKDLAEESSHTSANVVPGTAGYVAPELSAQTGEPSPASDLYSLGCVAFRLLTGQPVFDGQSPMALAMKHALEAPRPPSSLRPDIPPELDEIALGCLRKSPTDRPESASALRKALAAIHFDSPFTREDADAWWQDIASAEGR